MVTFVWIFGQGLCRVPEWSKKILNGKSTTKNSIFNNVYLERMFLRLCMNEETLGEILCRCMYLSASELNPGYQVFQKSGSL